MIDREQVRTLFLQCMPEAIVRMVDAYNLAPVVNEDGTSDCPVAAQLHYQLQERQVAVRELKAERQRMIEKLQEQMEEVRSRPVEPHWATEMDRYAHTPRFDRYCEELWANEAQVEKEVNEFKDRIAVIRCEIEIIDEFLQKAESKRYPGDLRNEFGRRPGERVQYDPRASRDAMIRRFLED